MRTSPPVNPLKNIGKRNMLVGAIVAIGGIAFTILSYVLATEGSYFIICRGAIIFGIIQFLTGFAQYTSPKETQEFERRRLNKAAFGVEEPNRTWECPQCKFKNPNKSFICRNCGLKLN